MRRFPILIACITILSQVAPMVAAEKLEGEIKAGVSDFIGIVHPEISLENQNISLRVEKVMDGNDTKYLVNDTLEIRINITDKSGRKFLILPRSILYSVIVTRDLSNVDFLPLRGVLKRIVLAVDVFSSVRVVDSIFGKKNDSIVIPLKYAIDENTTKEKINLHITAIGWLPGAAGGMKFLPIVAHKKVELTVTYNFI